MRKKAFRVVDRVIFYTFLAASLFTGIELYRVFMVYAPGADFQQIFLSVIGVSPFLFFGILSGVFISFPILLAALELYGAISASYIRAVSEKGTILLAASAVESFVRDTVSQIAGVDKIDVSVDYLRNDQIGIRMWLDLDEKNDFIRFSERIQQRVVQDLEFNFAISKIKYFKIMLESTDVTASAKDFKVEYK